MLDPHFKAMLEAEAAQQPADAPPLTALPLEMLRGFYVQTRQAQNLSTSPAQVSARDLAISGAAGDIGARLYTPPGVERPSALLVYFHGGGWVIGNLETHDAHCRRLALHSKAQVLAVDYRLAPEHPFPAGHDDAVAAVRWAFAHAAELGVDPARIGVGGDSAGGNLAACVSLDLRGDPVCKLRLQLLLYPATGPRTRTPSRESRDGPVLSRAAMDLFEASLAAEAHPQGVRAWPAQAASHADLPPAIIVTAGFDPLEDEGRDYAALITAAGGQARHVSYPSLVHDFYIMGDVSPAVPEAARETGEAVCAALA
ncbi:MAG: alpha/beta hydrolase [Alphaproteobacteria bacterium]|nr:alpha/beta hydrolase [Alphaproteobacteria bacterium]